MTNGSTTEPERVTYEEADVAATWLDALRGILLALEEAGCKVDSVATAGDTDWGTRNSAFFRNWRGLVRITAHSSSIDQSKLIETTAITAERHSASTPETEAISGPGKGEIQAYLKRLMQQSRGRLFEDGEVSELALRVQRAFKQNAGFAADALLELALQPDAEPRAMHEVFKWLGAFKNAYSQSARLYVCEQALAADVPRVRAGAALGLSWLDDPHAIPNLEEAVARETIPELKDDLQQVLDQLRDTQQCLAFSE